MSKLADATKQVEAATRDLKREQQEWNVRKADLQRDNLQLKTKNRALEHKNAALEEKIVHTEELIADAGRRYGLIQAKVTEIEAKLDEVETRHADKTLELADLYEEVKKRKLTIDSELEAYSVERKSAIKDDILATNQELIDNRTELKVIRTQIDDSRLELATLNQAAVQEQEEQKIRKVTIDEDLVAKQAELDELQRQADDVTASIKKALFERDNALLATAKAREEHNKFVAYESKARKILDAKDRELVERSSNIAQESQLLKNRRTFLPSL